MQEQHEKEGILTRELERLRAHLMEVEETYTAETLRLEELVQDLQSKLNTAEERLRSVSTAHTSARLVIQTIFTWHVTVNIELNVISPH